jgi:5-methylcytosine-specific restriction endonuclease McrA/rubrerythrin
MKERNSKILDLYKSGKTLEEIGGRFGFSRSRAQQIVIKELKKDILKRLGMKELTKEEAVLLDVATKEEVREISRERKSNEGSEIKKRIQKKIESLPHAKFITVSNYARALEERSDLIKKYFPKVVKEIIQKQKQLWSRHYNKCRICGTSSIKHRSNGLCENCYYKSELFKEMQIASRVRSSGKRRKKQAAYLKEYARRPDVIARCQKREDQKKYGGNREKAIERDGCRCQKCGISREDSKKFFRKDLFVYHMKGTGDNRLENLLTVCQKCHGKNVIEVMHKSVKL